MADATKTIEWFDSGREPKCRANPLYPNGIDVDMSKGAKVSCLIDLPYPAKRCGAYLVGCKTCGARIVLSTAGRTDDPRSVTIPCKQQRGSEHADPAHNPHA